jgi:hypothetical protein
MPIAGLNDGRTTAPHLSSGSSDYQTELPISRKTFFLFLATCAALHVLSRRVVTETAGIDDVDQVLRAQLWGWGYGPQPPFYTWLTKIFLGLFGYSVVSMLLLKETLMFSIYALVYTASRQLTRSHLCGLIAAALLQANPSIAWEAHRELTHTVLASLCSVGAIALFFRLDPLRWGEYVLFGICCGLGVLAKYNFVIVWVALLLGACCVPELRPVLFNRKFLLAILLTVLVCAPNLLWQSQHRELALSSVYKLKIAAQGNWALIFRGLKKWLVDLLGQLGPMVAILVLLLGKKALRPALPLAGEKLLWRAAGWLLLIVCASIIIFRIGQVMDRYVQPLVVWVPIALVAAFREHWSQWHAKLLLAVGAFVAIAIALAAPGRVLLTDSLKKDHEVLNLPFQKFAADLRAMAQDADCIIAENHPLAGNLRFWFPTKLVIDPEVGPLFRPGPRKTLLVWHARKDDIPPPELVKFAASFTGQRDITRLQTFEELLKYHRQRSYRLGAAYLE